MLKRNCFVLAFLVVLAASGVCADTGVQSIKVRDIATHYAVRAKIMLQGPQSVSAQTDDTGALRLSLLAGQYAQEISAPGYQTLKGNITILPGNNLPIEIMLAPLKPPEEERSLASQLRPGYTFIRGYAVDEQGQPVAGVRVRLKNAGVETITNESRAISVVTVALSVNRSGARSGDVTDRCSLERLKKRGA